MNYFLITPFLTGAIFILAGMIMISFPPKNINGIYGYRTPSSMKSKKRWDFAQSYSSKEMIKIGALLWVLSLLGFLFLPALKNVPYFFGVLIIIITSIVLIVRVELAIKKKFNVSEAG